LRPSAAVTLFQAFLQRVIDTAGDQEAALSPVGVVELVHGVHRADTAEHRRAVKPSPRSSFHRRDLIANNGSSMGWYWRSENA
jgi:hypothetical protein